jgi:hypothetical protein
LLIVFGLIDFGAFRQICSLVILNYLNYDIVSILGDYSIYCGGDLKEILQISPGKNQISGFGDKLR